MNLLQKLFKRKEKPVLHTLQPSDKIRLLAEQKAFSEDQIIGKVTIEKHCILIFLEEKNGNMFFMVRNPFFAPYQTAEDNQIIYFSTIRFCHSKAIKYKKIV